MRQFLLVLLLFPALLISGCSEDAQPTAPGEQTTLEVLPPNPAGMLLPGAATDNASKGTISLTPSPVLASAIKGTLLSTRIAAVIAPTATVQEVNVVMTGEPAAIVSMSAGDPYIVLVINPVADREAAEAIAATLLATGVFVHTRPGHTTSRSPEPLVNKDFPDGSDPEDLAYLTPSRTRAAWNLRRAAFERVSLVVPDTYLDSEYSEIPGLEFVSTGGRALTPEDGPAYAFGDLGFHLLGVAAADWDFDAEVSPHTGVDPVAAELLDVAAVHTYGLDDSEKIWAAAYGRLESGANILLTTETFEDPLGELIRYIDRAWLSLYWRRLVHGLMEGPDFVHIVAAGHTGMLGADFTEAVFNSVYGLATAEHLDAIAALDATEIELAAFQLSLQTDIAAEPQIGTPLPNILLVGSSDINGTESAFSSPESHIRAVGEGIPGPCLSGLSGCNGVTMTISDASAAAAQVAGLAAYLWHLEPDFTADEILARLQHAYAAGATPGVLDAWIAVLSTDASLADAPARKIMLDVSGPSNLPDGRFTEHDLSAFMTAFDAFAGEVAPDWSVYDLNGDGRTGGSTTARMDLDVNNLPGFTSVSREINGGEASFDETAVTDEEVLCYYAWTDLYTGSAAERASLLGCAGGEGLFVQISDLPGRASPGETATVTVRAGYNVPGGVATYAAGVRISFDPQGMTVSPNNGVTNANGFFQTTVTYGEDDNEMNLGTWAETDTEEAFADASTLRHNLIEVVTRYAFVSASIFAAYQPELGEPSVEIVRVFEFDDTETLAPFSRTFTPTTGGSGAGMIVSAEALSGLTTNLELANGTELRGMNLTSHSFASMTLQNPNFNTLNYGASTSTTIEVDIEFTVWGEPAAYSLQGSVVSNEYEVDFDGQDGQVFLCNSYDEPCGSISSSGSLPPGGYDLSLYQVSHGLITWSEGCTDCITSGTQSESGSLSVDFTVNHGAR